MTQQARPSPGGSLYGAAVEYGLHGLLWLMEPRDHPVSSRDLADIQGVSPSAMAKIMPRLEKAGLVVSTGGINGGYRLARPGEEISVLQIADAIDGRRAVLDCKEIRRRCVLFEDAPPTWAIRKVCGIHGVMLRAEKAMRDEMAKTSLADLVHGVAHPPEFRTEVANWLDQRDISRKTARLGGLRRSRTAPEPSVEDI